MSVADVEPERLDVVTDRHDRAFLGHPKGLGFLAVVEGCERFSYYSMTTLLTLYMVNYLLTPAHFDSVWGLGWVQQHLSGGKTGQALASSYSVPHSSPAGSNVLVMPSQKRRARRRSAAEYVRR